MSFDNRKNITYKDATEFPTLLAFPLYEYMEETHPVAKLWYACDTVEILLRFIVIVNLTELSKQERLPRQLLNELNENIEHPTLGRWKRLAAATTKSLSPKPIFLPKLTALMDCSILPFLEGRKKTTSPHNSFISLRNRLAHGAGMTKQQARKLLSTWNGPFHGLIQNLYWMKGLHLYTKNNAGNIIKLQGIHPGQPDSRDITDYDLTQINSLLTEKGEIVIFKGNKGLSLRPFASYSIPRSYDPEGDHAKIPVPQIYTRRGKINLILTPIGSKEVCESVSDKSALTEFLHMIPIDRMRKNHSSKSYKVSDFIKDFYKDAESLIGRQAEIKKLEKTIRHKDEGTVWIHGSAGIGKSFLIAKIFKNLKEENDRKRLILAYRFKTGDHRCYRDSFLQFLVERTGELLGKKEILKTDNNTNKINILKKHLQTLPFKQHILILDGIDEICAQDKDFLENVITPLLLPRVLFVCTGRNLGKIPAFFSEKGAFEPFPQGLNPLTEQEAREMILEKIGPLRKKLLMEDCEIERDGERVIVNNFVEKVTENAKGLPIYVKYVIGDILSGRMRGLDVGERLPDSLRDYHKNLLLRCNIGPMQQVITPLLSLIAIAYEPMPEKVLYEILEASNIIPEGDVSLLNQGLSFISSMIRKTISEDGDGEGFVIYHESLRDFMESSQITSNIVLTARKNIISLINRHTELASEARRYIYRWGIRTSIDQGDMEKAVAMLTDVDFIFHRLNFLDKNSVNIHLAELRESMALMTKKGNNISYIYAYERFFDNSWEQMLSIPESWNLGRAFIQMASISSFAVVKTEAEEWVSVVKPDWYRLLPKNSQKYSPLFFYSSRIKGEIYALAVAESGNWLIIGVTHLKHNVYTVEKWTTEGDFLGQFSGHNSYINALAIFKGDSRIASCSADGTVKIWDADTFAMLTEFKHPGTFIIRNLAVNEQSGKIYAAGSLPNVIEWDMQHPEDPQKYGIHNGWIYAIDFNPSNGMLAVGSTDGVVALWNTLSGKCKREVNVPADTILSIAQLSGERVAFSGNDGEIQLLDFTHEKIIKNLGAHDDAVLDMHYISKNNTLISSAKDGRIIKWNLTDDTHTEIMHCEEWITRVRATEANGGLYIASARRDGVAHIHDQENGTLKAQFPKKSVGYCNAIADPQTGVVLLQDSWNRIWTGPISKPWEHDLKYSLNMNATYIEGDNLFCFHGPAAPFLSIICANGELLHLSPENKNIISMAYLGSGMFVLFHADGRLLKLRNQTNDASSDSKPNSEEHILKEIIIAENSVKTAHVFNLNHENFILILDQTLYLVNHELEILAETTLEKTKLKLIGKSITSSELVLCTASGVLIKLNLHELLNHKNFQYTLHNTAKYHVSAFEMIEDRYTVMGFNYGFILVYDLYKEKMITAWKVIDSVVNIYYYDNLINVITGKGLFYQFTLSNESVKP